MPLPAKPVAANWRVGGLADERQPVVRFDHLARPAVRDLDPGQQLARMRRSSRS